MCCFATEKDIIKSLAKDGKTLETAGIYFIIAQGRERLWQNIR